jgi:hypothetical protein
MNFCAMDLPPTSGALSMTMVSFIAGASISTADFALSYFAPSTMLAQWISSESGATSMPNFVLAMCAIHPVQLV